MRGKDVPTCLTSSLKKTQHKCVSMYATIYFESQIMVDNFFTLFASHFLTALEVILNYYRFLYLYSFLKMNTLPMMNIPDQPAKSGRTKIPNPKSKRKQLGHSPRLWESSGKWVAKSFCRSAAGDKKLRGRRFTQLMPFAMASANVYIMFNSICGCS